MPLKLVSLDVEKLELFASLLGGPDFGGCFCAVWTSFDQTWTKRCQDPTKPNLAITRQDVMKGRKPGFFVYREADLIGWTGSGPKTEFPWLREKLASRLSDFSPRTWAIGCLAIKREFQGQGFSEMIVQAIIEKARTAGAQFIEAYPTRPWDQARSYRGSFSLFERLGFTVKSIEVEGEAEILLMQRQFSGLLS